jgi:hypothetical protein
VAGELLLDFGVGLGLGVGAASPAKKAGHDARARSVPSPKDLIVKRVFKVQPGSARISCIVLDHGDAG